MVIAEFAGTWQGTSALHLPGTRPDRSDSTLSIKPVFAGFARNDYEWAYQGAPQKGSLLCGVDAACWIDTWHMGDKMMHCTVAPREGATYSCVGSYCVTNGPDWGWRIDLIAVGDTVLRVWMVNIAPEGGREILAVDALYSQA